VRKQDHAVHEQGGSCTTVIPTLRHSLADQSARTARSRAFPCRAKRCLPGRVRGRNPFLKTLRRPVRGRRRGMGRDVVAHPQFECDLPGAPPTVDGVAHA